MVTIKDVQEIAVMNASREHRIERLTNLAWMVDGNHPKAPEVLNAVATTIAAINAEASNA